MVLTWGEYRAQILRSVLADTDNATWQPEQVHDFIGWALDRFCVHTALLKQITITDGDMRSNGITPYDFSTDSQIELPDDIFENLDIGAQVFATDTNGVNHFYDPIQRTPQLTPQKPVEPSFWVWPETTLNLSHAPGKASTLSIWYFAYYDVPDFEADTAVIQIPRWAQKPLASLVGAFALESLGIQSATIDRWKTEDDAGNPEQNALRAQQQFLLKHYEYEISKHAPQDRANLFRRFQGNHFA